MHVAEAKTLAQNGEFEAGTMLPKIEAAITYLEKVPDGRVLITDQEDLVSALKGKSGTIILA